MTQTETLLLALQEFEANQSNENFLALKHAVKTSIAIKSLTTEQEPKQKPPFIFRRFVGGKEMAQGVGVHREVTLESAIRMAVKICPSEYLPTVLVYTPSQRTWVGLTNEEMEAAIPFGNLSGEYSYDDILNIILLIQAKLRSKND
jgi:hypothetical protein